MDNTEVLLLQIEELFERFRNLPQNARAVILEKIRIKLLEEFKDFVIEENDNTQDMIVEIPFSNSAEFIQRTENFVVLPNQEDNDVTSGFLSNSNDDCSRDFPVQPSSTNPNSSENEPSTVKDQPQTRYLRLMCNYCGKRFSRKSLFDHHIDRHKNERTFECSVCSQQFNVKGDLSKHLKSHTGERNFVCPICHKQLVNNTTLKNHIRVIHQKLEKYICNKCDYFAYSKSTLKEHIRIKHEKAFKKYACVICKGVYNSRTLLKVHLRSHTGEKPYKCKKCDASFVTSGRLTNHLNCVHGESKFPCNACPKTFKTIHKLKRHMYTHTRLKPYLCPFCTNYASNTQGNLSKHVKAVHQMNEFSYFKYKRIMRGDIEEVKDEWIQNAEQFTNDYLKKLSNSGGEPVSIEQLKEMHQLQKQKVVKPSTNEVDVFDAVVLNDG